MKVCGREILIGCDPEVPVVGPDGHYVPAHGMIEGTKEAPQLVKNGMVQVDGLALEFGITPAATEHQFVTRIHSVLRQLEAQLPKGHKLAIDSTFEFTKKQIEELPPEALVLGCDPDYSAYTLAKNPKPNLPRPTMRSAGGHVHFGFSKDIPVGDQQHMLDCAALTIELDRILGVPSFGWDNDNLRRKIYGAAGAFRPKSYGMEYRVLSNQWLKSDDTIRQVYRASIRAVSNLLREKDEGSKKISLYGGKVFVSPKQVINEGMIYVGKAIYQEEMLGV